MRSLVRAILLGLALSCTAYAGNMPFPAASPEPTPTNAQTATVRQTLDGQHDMVHEIALSVLVRLITLF